MLVRIFLGLKASWSNEKRDDGGLDAVLKERAMVRVEKGYIHSTDGFVAS
jgi:hypothetical protein